MKTGTVLRHQHDGNRISLPCPKAVINYINYMGGVDRGDQLRGYYNCRSRSRKFIFYFLLDPATTNTFIPHTRYTPSPTFKNVKDFWVSLAKSLIGDYCSLRRAVRGGFELRSLPLRHFPIKMEGDGLSKRGRCTLCSKKNKRNDSCWLCNECEVWLCHTGMQDSNCSGTGTWERSNIQESNTTVGTTSYFTYVYHQQL